jgi:WD40 repeat protein
MNFPSCTSTKTTSVSYNLSETNKLFYNTDINRYINQIACLNSLKLDLAHGAGLKSILKSGLIFLREDNDSETYKKLKSELLSLIDKISKIENLDQKVIKKGEKIYSLIYPKKEFGISLSSKPVNVFDFVNNQKIGAQTSSLEDFVQHRIKNNMIIDKCTETSFKEKKVISDDIMSIDVQYPFAVTVSYNKIIKFWNLETEICLWTHVIEPRISGSNKVNIVNDYVIYKIEGNFGPLDASEQDDNSLEDQNENHIGIIDIQTGKIKNTIKIKNETLILDNAIFCILENNDIEEWDFNGQLVQTIQLEKFSNEDRPTILGSEKFLVLIDAKNIIHIYDRLNKCKKKVILSDPETISIYCSHINGHRLICGFEVSYRSGCPDCCVIDLDKGHIINQYKIQTVTNFDVTAITMDNERIYLGYSSGIIVAINISEKKYELVGEIFGSICQLLENGQILLNISRIGVDDYEIKTWDLKSLTPLLTSKNFQFRDFLFNSNNIYRVKQDTLIQMNYLLDKNQEEIKNANQS